MGHPSGWREEPRQAEGEGGGVDAPGSGTGGRTPHHVS